VLSVSGREIRFTLLTVYPKLPAGTNFGQVPPNPSEPISISFDPFAPDMRDGLSSAASTPLEGDPFTFLVPGRKMKVVQDSGEL